MWKDVVHLLIVSRHFGGLPCAKLVLVCKVKQRELWASPAWLGLEVTDHLGKSLPPCGCLFLHLLMSGLEQVEGRAEELDLNVPEPWKDYEPPWSIVSTAEGREGGREVGARWVVGC